jgi:hypothetical protein
MTLTKMDLHFLFQILSPIISYTLAIGPRITISMVIKVGNNKALKITFYYFTYDRYFI